MSIPARLSRILHRALGDQGADDLVSWMTRVESGRSELTELMTAWRAATDAKFDEVYRRLDGIDRRFDRLESRMERLESRMTDQFRWSFAFWIGSVGATMAIVHFMK